MDILTELPVLAASGFAGLLNTVTNIVYLVLGLGLVIFFHELGHFAVAKWCDVYVERFSIGFGPILWSRRKGETEYAVSLIPFGGYVKMLGQDDMDPSQLTSEEIAENPRSYSSKPVGQRMAIISAGVIMNIITGMLFYAVAYGIGVQVNPAEVGYVQVGKPGWQAGIAVGDEITKMNGRKIESFTTLKRTTALSSGEATIEGVRRDPRTGKQQKFKIKLTPDGRGTRRRIGVGYASSLTLVNEFKEGITVAVPGTPAARAVPPFEFHDTLVKFGNGRTVTELRDFPHLEWLLASNRDRAVELYVRRHGAEDGDLTKITVERNPFRTLGLWMDIGPIVAVQHGSPAARAGLKPGDKIVAVAGVPVGGKIDPLTLPDRMEKEFRAHPKLELTVLRKDAAETETLTVELLDSDKVVPAWVDAPLNKGEPLAIPTLGVAVHAIPTVLNVEPGSPAEKAGIKKDERIRKLVFVLPDGESDNWYDDKPYEIEFGKKDDSGSEINNWVHAFWLMQLRPTRDVTLTVSDKVGNTRDVTLSPRSRDDWYLPVRGVIPLSKLVTLKSDGFFSAIGLGYLHARNTLSAIYLTLRNLMTGDISYKELAGPVGIAKVAYRVVDRSIPDFLVFLGFLSINLAVLNFLPIPVLDGGHMVFLLWEAVTRRKPSERVVIAATYFGLAFVLGLMGLVMYLDLFVNKI